MTPDVNITIIGAGVIGLAIAEKLSKRFENIFVIERHGDFGQETSSRNSEVIHSGIYYPKDSLKAKFCVQGRDMLYELCPAADIPYRKCGKLIVATTESEVQELNALLEKANNNGVFNLELLGAEEIKEMEPHVSAIQALYSPSTGIIDSHALMKYFEKESMGRGVALAYKSVVDKITNLPEGYHLDIMDAGGEKFSFSSAIVVNCAGLESDHIARLVGINDPAYKIHFCKGDYFTVNPPKNRLVNRLIYPVPNKKLVGLGIHATVDMGGGLKLGPDTTYLDENVYDYKVDESSKEKFYQSARRFLPFIEMDDLNPDISGIRPKVQAPGDTVKDFIIRNETERGFKNFINLIGIESPGLTSSMAIAAYVDELIQP
jgi:L-2-hydroxyglutarate oxidase LhgO